MSQTVRGFARPRTSSGAEPTPVAFSFARACTAAGAWSNTTHSCPARSNRRTMFEPILPNPIIPSCICDSVCGWRGSSVRAQARNALQERSGRAVGRRRSVAAQRRHDAFREHLAELDAPLIERIDVPDRALSEHAVLIQGDQLAERRGCQALEQQRIGGEIALR